MILTLILVGSLLLRVWGAGQGYPAFYGHVDEIGVAASIWNFFRNATLEPTEFTYPAFYSYLVAAAMWVAGALGLVDLPQGPRLVERLVFLSYADPAFPALIGRTVSAVAGVAAVAVVYRVGSAVVGPATGLVAALGLGVAITPVYYAHHALPDSTACLLSSWVMLIAWRVHERGSWRDYALAGVACGLLLATKYNGGLCALGVVAAHARRRWPLHVHPRAVAAAVLGGWYLWLAGLVAVGCAAAASPYLVLAWERYLALATYQVSSLGFALTQTSPWWWIPAGLVTGELAVGGAMLAGIAVAARRHDAFDVMALAAFVPAFVYIGSWTRESLHYLLPYYPWLVICGARVCTGLARRTPFPQAPWIAVGLAAAVPNLWIAIDGARALQRPDTRARAAAWVEDNVPHGSTVAMTWLPYCPRLQTVTAREQILSWFATRPSWQRELRKRWASRPAYDIVNLEVWLKKPVVPDGLRDAVDLEDPETRRVFSRSWRSLSRLRADGVTHLVLPDAVYRRYLQPRAEPPDDPAAQFRMLFNRAYFESLLEDPGVEQLTYIGSDPSVRGGAISIFRLR